MKINRLIILNILFSFILFSQDATFVASVDNNSPQVGEQMTLTFTFSGSGGKNFHQPDLNNFFVLGGPNQSTNMQFVNGVVSSSFTITYQIQARSEGKFTIGSATIEAGGKQYSSNNIEIEVRKSIQKPASPQTGSTTLSSENLFLRATIDKSKVYVGEQITIVYKIYTRLRISNYSIKAFPATSGFWVEEIPQTQQIQLINEVVNGVQYQVGELKRIALFPTQSGILEVKPFEITCQVQVQSRRKTNDPFDIFNDPFFNTMQTQNVQIKSNSVKINSISLPLVNVPKSFSGAVGNYQMNIITSKTKTETNEAITLRMKINGTGNVKLIETPELKLSNEFELYAPKVNDNINTQSNPITGTKMVEWLLIPRFPGDKKIPAYAWSYFNPSQNKYVTISSSEISLTIKQGSKSGAQIGNGISKEEIEILNQDIRFIIISNTSFTDIGESGKSFTTRMLLYFIPVLVAGGLVYFRIKNEKSKFYIIDYKSRIASRVAKNKLKIIESYLKSDEQNKFFTELSNTLTLYICDKLNIPFSQLSEVEIIKQLKEKNINIELIDSFTALQKNCEFARFAPSAEISSTKNELYNESEKVIFKLEEELNK